ncbi:hypothetical protein VN12_26850 [Pirellula sp. SH-Sr6A]|uniref:hypothetical protein n=1 Tax=Pirellula sp. SH-Sr6A TaxID=1632865 RepID=UPI00078BCEDA|nr:hypothetical protein [Pirellula sp. SH-Sr6A]AMV35741.1 hypothetical protein VN12_26850 [Pirellula sp. SH-Sr6A]
MVSQDDEWLNSFSDWVSLSQAAEIIGNTRASVLRNGYAGRYPFRWRGGHLFYYRKSLVRAEMGGPNVIKKEKQTLNRTNQKLVMQYRDFLALEFDDFIVEIRNDSEGSLHAHAIVCVNGRYHQMPPKMIVQNGKAKKSA